MSKSILILYAAGQAEQIAKAVAAFARKSDAEDAREAAGRCYRFELHASQGRVLMIASAHGQNEAQPEAERFYDWLRAPTTQLSCVRCSVYGRGGAGYRDFTGFKEAMEAEFARLGATRVAARTGHGLDYEGGLDAWFDAVFASGGKDEETAAAA